MEHLAPAGPQDPLRCGGETMHDDASSCTGGWLWLSLIVWRMAAKADGARLESGPSGPLSVAALHVRSLVRCGQFVEIAVEQAPPCHGPLAPESGNCVGTLDPIGAAMSNLLQCEEEAPSLQSARAVSSVG